MEWLRSAICLLHSILSYWLVLTRSAKYWLVFLLHHLNNQFFFTKVFFVCLAGFWTHLWNWWQVKTKLFLPKNYSDTTNFRQERLKESILSICVFLYHHWWFQGSREKVWASKLPSTSRMLPNYLCCYGTQFLKGMEPSRN